MMYCYFTMLVKMISSMSVEIRILLTEECKLVCVIEFLRLLITSCLGKNGIFFRTYIYNKFVYHYRLHIYKRFTPKRSRCFSNWYFKGLLTIISDFYCLSTWAISVRNAWERAEKSRWSSIIGNVAMWCLFAPRNFCPLLRDVWYIAMPQQSIQFNFVY